MTDSTLKADNYSGIVCAEGYYLSDDNLCRPLCSLWVDPPGGVGSGNIVNIISAVIALFSSAYAALFAILKLRICVAVRHFSLCTYQCYAPLHPPGDMQGNVWGFELIRVIIPHHWGIMNNQIPN